MLVSVASSPRSGLQAITSHPQAGVLSPPDAASRGNDPSPYVPRPPELPPIDEYYAAAQGKQGAELLWTLHNIIRTGHVDRGYRQARDEMFELVDDPDNNDLVEDVYSGESRGPVHNASDAMNVNLNAEHTWPQSKGATGIAQSDLHQVMPADVGTNARRGNYPYGIVARAEWNTGEGVNQSRLGVDQLGRTVFEPRNAIKGDIARGLLYFYTRYNMSRPARYTLENFQVELPVLLKWNKDDPVDKYEQDRNELAAKVQGNRNPYVDHPEWVDAVDFAASMKKN